MKRWVMCVILAGIAVLAIIGYIGFGERELPADASAATGEPSPGEGRPDPPALSIKEQDMTPVIDPGHGGGDGGAVSITGVYESGINLDIALKTSLLMRFLGITPVMTRETDISIHDPDKTTLYDQKQSDIKNRVKIVNDTPGGVLISIHQNIFEQEQYHGAQVFHNGSEPNKSFAASVQEALRAGLDPGNRRQPVEADFYILKYSQKPSVLVECGFLSNREEEILLRAPVYQRKIALVLVSEFCKLAP